MPDNFPMGVIVLGDSCPSKRGDCPRGNGSGGSGPGGGDWLREIVLCGNCPQG